jgi:hypothetical protein
MIPFLLSLFFLLPSLTQCMETDLSLKIKSLKHERNNLRSELEVEREHFWMWNPKDDGFHFIYKARDIATLRKTIKLYSPSMRVKGYSVLGVIAISPNISVQEKEDITQELFNLKFRPTSKDKDLAYLESWEMNLEEPLF